MSNSISTLDNVQTMSSLEIARLTGKEHRNILADIRHMLKELDIDLAVFFKSYKDAKNRQCIYFDLPQCETITLVSGYGIKMCAAVIDRWEEVEAFQRFLDMLASQRPSIPRRYEPSPENKLVLNMMLSGVKRAEVRYLWKMFALNGLETTQELMCSKVFLTLPLNERRAWFIRAIIFRVHTLKIDVRNFFVRIYNSLIVFCFG